MAPVLLHLYLQQHQQGQRRPQPTLSHPLLLLQQPPFLQQQQQQV
jgi:hypothetical protein